MQRIHKPLKRSKQLSPLSREHHQALLFVWKIKQGIAAGIGAGRIAAYCTWFWQQELKAHMEKEEAVLTEVLATTHPLMYNMIEDHSAIRAKFSQINDDPSYMLLKRLAQIMYYHIRFEERVLFPHIEQVANSEMLEKIGRQLASPAHPEDWKDEFWLTQRVNSSSFQPLHQN